MYSSGFLYHPFRKGGIARKRRGENSKIPSVAEKESNNDGESRAHGLAAVRMRRAKNRDVSESASLRTKKPAIAVSIMMAARKTDGEQPVIPA